MKKLINLVFFMIVWFTCIAQNNYTLSSPIDKVTGEIVSLDKDGEFLYETGYTNNTMYLDSNKIQYYDRMVVLFIGGGFIMQVYHNCDKIFAYDLFMGDHCIASNQFVITEDVVMKSGKI